MVLITDPALTPFFRKSAELYGERKGKVYSAEGHRTYIRKHRVTLNPNNTSNKWLGPVSVSLCPGLPMPGSYYVSGYDWDKLALCIDQDAEEENKGDWQTWIVTSTYSTDLKRGFPEKPGAANSNQGAQNDPSFEKPEVSWSWGTVQVALARDMMGKPILNSAQLPFSPPPTFAFQYPILTITRNELRYNLDRMEAFNGNLNEDPFLNRPKGAILIEIPSNPSKYKGSFGYWRPTYKISFAPAIPNQNMDNSGAIPILEPETDGIGPPDTNDNYRWIYRPWQPYILDAGMDEITLRDGEPAIIPIYRNHAPVTHPVLLDGGGHEQQPNAAGFRQPVFLKFEVLDYVPIKELLVRGLDGPPP